MKSQQPFSKDDPSYSGMIGLIAATTATDCKCSRCEHLRSFLPPEISAMAQSKSFKTQTKQVYEDVVEESKNKPTSDKPGPRERLKQTPEGRQALARYKGNQKQKYQDMMGTSEHENRKQQMRDYINNRRLNERGKK
jgi:hypothetical protein